MDNEMGSAHDSSRNSQNDVAIIYASTSGNVEFVCQRVCHSVTESGAYKALCLQRSEVVDMDSMKDTTHFIFATSTWEHGVVNPYFVPVLKYIKANDMTGKTASFIGLGDTRYEPVLFCEGINEAERAWAKAGGTKRGETLKINNIPHDQTAKIDAWLNETFRETS